MPHVIPPTANTGSNATPEQAMSPPAIPSPSLAMDPPPIAASPEVIPAPLSPATETLVATSAVVVMEPTLATPRNNDYGVKVEIQCDTRRNYLHRSLS